MTSLTTVMSSVPLGLASGPGFESRMVIGIVVLTGVAVSTILTLFVIPSAYYLLAQKTQSPEFTEKEIQAQSDKHPI